MARLDVEKEWKSIGKTIGHSAVSNPTTNVGASNDFRSATGRVRTPPAGDKTPAQMSSPAAVNTKKASQGLTFGKGNGPAPVGDKGKAYLVATKNVNVNKGPAKSDTIAEWKKPASMGKRGKIG